MPCGSRRAACVIAPCTSTAAPSRLRSSVNSSVTCVEPSELTDVIDSRPAIIENWFSSGVATDAPIVSGLASGSCAVTRSVGKSTLGRSLTGSERYATSPNNAIAAMSRLVAIGRLINPSEIFTGTLGSQISDFRLQTSDFVLSSRYRLCDRAPNLARLEQAGHVGVDDRRQIQRDELRDDQAADDREPERLARLAARAVAERDRNRAEQRRHGRHHDRAEADDAAFVDRFGRRLAVLPLGFEREV